MRIERCNIPIRPGDNAGLTTADVSYRVEGFHYGGWLSFLTYLVLPITGFAEWATVEGCHRQGKLTVR